MISVIIKSLGILLYLQFLLNNGVIMKKVCRVIADQSLCEDPGVVIA